MSSRLNREDTQHYAIVSVGTNIDPEENLRKSKEILVAEMTFLGEIKREYVELLQQADAIFIEELRQSDWYDKTAQAFAVFLPVKSVGVMGDGRTYDYVVALRAVQTTDFMTADWATLPHELLARVSSRIINEVRGINRVTYDISSKPPATIEWE